MPKVIGPLGLKSLRWGDKVKRWLSPSYIHPWTYPLTYSKCDTCPTIEEGGFTFVDIRESCTCGIYLTHTLDEVYCYKANEQFPVFLCEGLGTYWIHDFGITASIARVVGIVNVPSKWSSKEKGNNFEWMSMEAATFFQVRLIPLRVAYQAIYGSFENIPSSNGWDIGYNLSNLKREEKKLNE